MSTPSTAIETVWNTYVWDTAPIVAISPVSFLFDPTKESEFELSALMSAQIVNFWSCMILKSEEWIGAQVLQEKFTVTADYTREKDTDGDSWAAVRNALETLQTQVRTVLGPTWQGTINFYEPQAEPPKIEETNIQGTACWKGSFQFFAMI